MRELLNSYGLTPEQAVYVLEVDEHGTEYVHFPAHVAPSEQRLGAALEIIHCIFHDSGWSSASIMIKNREHWTDLPVDCPSIVGEITHFPGMLNWILAFFNKKESLPSAQRLFELLLEKEKSFCGTSALPNKYRGRLWRKAQRSTLRANALLEREKESCVNP